MTLPGSLCRHCVQPEAQKAAIALPAWGRPNCKPLTSPGHAAWLLPRAASALVGRAREAQSPQCCPGWA